MYVLWVWTKTGWVGQYYQESELEELKAKIQECINDRTNFNAYYSTGEKL